MALNQWSKRLFVLLAAICGVGGFLIGSSSSQEVKHDADQGEVGRYQMVMSSSIDIKVFDTKTAKFWQLNIEDPEQRWVRHPGPFAKTK